MKLREDMQLREDMLTSKTQEKEVEATLTIHMDVGTGGHNGVRAPPLLKDLDKVALFVLLGCPP